MQGAIIRRFINFSTLMVLVAFAAGASLGQGHGHGNGKHGGDQGGGPGRGNGGGNPGNGNGHGGWKHGGGQPQAPQIQMQQPQQLIWAQRGNGNGNGHGKHGGGRPQIPQQIYVQPQPVYRQPQPQQIYRPSPPAWNNGGYRNYGQQRAAEVHSRNAERKALKEEQKAWDRQLRESQRPVYVNPQPYYPQYQQQPNYPRYPRQRSYEQYVQPYAQPSNTWPQPGYSTRYRYQSQPQYQYYNYVPGYTPYAYSPYSYSYDQPRRTSVKDFLRDLIFSVLGANAGYDNSYYDNGFAGYQVSGYRTGYIPLRYSAYQPTYRNYGYNSGYGYLQPAYFDNGGYVDARSGLLPLDPVDLLTSGNGLDSELFSQLIAVGYTQGYNDGLAARSARARDAYYDDPYVYATSSEDSIYDPYSVSLGENRRCLSQGYDLGYQDALNNDRSAARFLQNGNVDLVSVLLSSLSTLS